MSDAWNRTVTLAEAHRAPVTLDLTPDEGVRAHLARTLGLNGLPALSAKIHITPWLDGAEISGRFSAVVDQICSVTAEAFEQAVEGEIAMRVVPPGSENAATEGLGEIELDPDAPDPPDVLEDETIDVAAYVIEHLLLELDPFPRKPGASFDYRPTESSDSPFAALAKLKKSGS